MSLTILKTGKHTTAAFDISEVVAVEFLKAGRELDNKTTITLRSGKEFSVRSKDAHKIWLRLTENSQELDFSSVEADSKP